MSTLSPEKGTIKISTALEIIVATIVIIGFVFGATQWGDIQQYFWRQKIVGTWQDQESGMLYSFDKDGNFTAGGMFPTNGVYKFTDSKHFSMQYSGLVAIIGIQSMEVEFSQNRMYWKDQALGFEYIYIKIP